tara:strand:- start:1269 stop:2555 length:1287 start_codon:yes stop_codon:yes gene_type:complete
MVVIKKFYFFVFLFIFFISNNLAASRILDHETENFISSIIAEIKNTNNINRDLKFTIISSNEINAYVDQNNLIYITTSLIENCEDYVALLSVIAHEIGHIDRNHISNRKSSLRKLRNINSLSNLSIIAGSMISNNPEMLKGLAISSAGISNVNINFSKDQEREADYYSLETLKKLNIYSDSIIKLLNTIEERSIEKGLTKEMIKISTHPYFEERIDIINFINQHKKSNYDSNKNIEFKYIRSKYLGYNGRLEIINKLENPFKAYALSILKAKNGDLKGSLKELNRLISLNERNIYFLETKGDILYSYGYTNESLKFYKQVLKKLPENLYAQIRIFENMEINELSKDNKNELFYENLNLLEKFYNNQKILSTYLNLSMDSKKEDWINFLNFWINKKNDKEIIKIKLKEFKETNDKDLISLINIILKNIS